METYLPGHYVERKVPKYYHDLTDQPKVWQPEVYRLALSFAQRDILRPVVDIGCGNCKKLKQFRKYGINHIIGLDYGANLGHADCCAHTHEVDLEKYDSMPTREWTEDLYGTVICADVIEHLVDFRPLLTLLRTAVILGGTVILSTPSRAHSNTRQFGPPTNPCHVREWNLEEFRALLCHYGLGPKFLGLTISHEIPSKYATIVAVISENR